LPSTWSRLCASRPPNHGSFSAKATRMRPSPPPRRLPRVASTLRNFLSSPKNPFLLDSGKANVAHGATTHACACPSSHSHPTVCTSPMASTMGPRDPRRRRNPLSRRCRRPPGWTIDDAEVHRGGARSLGEGGVPGTVGNNLHPPSDQELTLPSLKEPTHATPGRRRTP
jgi:hypothetical protein